MSPPPAYYAARILAGVCVTCGTDPARKGRVCCQGCNDKAEARVKLWRAARKADGLCIRCNRRRVTLNHCRRHANEAAARNRAAYAARRRAIAAA